MACAARRSGAASPPSASRGSGLTTARRGWCPAAAQRYPTGRRASRGTLGTRRSCSAPPRPCPGPLLSPRAFSCSFPIALGDLLLDIGRDALVGLVKRGLAGDGLAEPADHRVEDDAIVDIALQPVGDRREARDPLTEHLERGLGLRRGLLVLEPLLCEPDVARDEERALVELRRDLLARKILDQPRYVLRMLGRLDRDERGPAGHAGAVRGTAWGRNGNPVERVADGFVELADLPRPRFIHHDLRVLEL